jgi:hypothetical protein
MGFTHFLMKRLKNVKTKISLHVLAYNLKRADCNPRRPAAQCSYAGLRGRRASRSDLAALLRDGEVLYDLGRLG